MLPTLVTLVPRRRRQEDPLGLHLIGELQVPWTQAQARVPTCMCMYTHYTHPAHIHTTHITHTFRAHYTQTHTTHNKHTHTTLTTHTIHNTQTTYTYTICTTHNTHTHTPNRNKNEKKNFKRFMQSFLKIKITRTQYIICSFYF